MIALIVIGFIIGITALVGLGVMFLWNWIMPYLFELPTISFWMAWGIMLLIGFLFSGIRGTFSKN